MGYDPKFHKQNISKILKISSFASNINSNRNSSHIFYQKTHIHTICNKCQLQFINRKELYAHIRDIHWRSFKCKFCGAQFGNKQKINRHLNNDPFCRQAKEKYESVGNADRMEVEIMDEANDDKSLSSCSSLSPMSFENRNHWKCCIFGCDRYFSKRQYLRKHLRRHKIWNEKKSMVGNIKKKKSANILCGVCDQYFLNWKLLQVHFILEHNASVTYI